MQAQNCSYVFEYRDPASGRVMFVGRSKGWGAWEHVQKAMQGAVSGKAYLALSRWLRHLIDAGTLPEVLAPKIVGCFPSEKAIKEELERRLTLYGVENLLNSGDHRVTGADPDPAAPESVCCIGDGCVYVRESAATLRASARQVGHFAQCIPNEHLGTIRGGAKFRHYPILNSEAVNRITRERAERDFDPSTGYTIEQFYITFAAAAIAKNLTEKDGNVPNLQEAKYLAGFIRSVSDNDFFIVEQDWRGNLRDVLPVTLPPGDFILAEEVFQSVATRLRTADQYARTQIYGELEDGTAAKSLGGMAAYTSLKVAPKMDYKAFVPNTTSTPAPPLPNPAAPAEYNPALTAALQRMTDGFARRTDFTPPPLKPKKVDSPDLINALARFEALITTKPTIHASAGQPDIDPRLMDDMARSAQIRADLYHSRPWRISRRSAVPSLRRGATAHAGKRVGSGQYRVLFRTR